MEEISRSGTLVPKDITDNAEKMTFIATQREKLRMLLSALEKEASDLSNEEVIQKDVERRLGEVQGEDMKKSRSEAEFDTIDDQEELGTEKPSKTAAAGWMPWNWAQSAKGEAKARSTGVDKNS